MVAPILVAPDSFKGTLSAAQVADALALGVEQAGAVADRCPLADGGEGTLDALAPALGAERRRASAHDPIGRPIEAEWGWAPHSATAIVETAAASGLALVAAAERDAWAASSAGTGELIAAAAAAGARTILLAAGGSATTDGGAGALAALAAAGAGEQAPAAAAGAGVAPLDAATIASATRALRGARLVVLCDVRTPFERAAATFAPQKGADPAMTQALAERLDRLAARLPRDPRGHPMTGCAGGLSGGLWAALDARLVPGAAHVLDALGFDRRLRGARAVVTGEGRLDAQTAEGKLVAEVARRAAAAGIPAYAVVGHDALGTGEARALGLTAVTEAGSPAALQDVGAQLARSATRPADVGAPLDPGAEA